MSDDTILRVITAFNVGVGKYSKLVRRLLPLYRGYECKEPESGKFTLSFRCDSCQLYCVAVCLWRVLTYASLPGWCSRFAVLLGQ